MEIINLLVILSTGLICIFWAIRKRKEIASIKVDFDDENTPLEQSSKRNILEEQEDLEYISKIFQKTIMTILKKILKTCTILFFCMSILIWIFLEEKITNFAQSIYFFIGAMGQIFVGFYIFKNHNIYDTKVVMFARITKWHALDHIIKINNYMTLSNQALNLIIFSSTYYISTFFGIDVANMEISERNFEKFHRRFLAFGFGSVFAFFVIKSLATVFSHGSYVVCEILARQNNEGIEEDHPKNPARILINLSESFFQVFQNALEFNALTNMGLCIFQDFFVTRSVYLLDRGFLNSVAIYSFGMLGSLVAMVLFRNMNKFKLSDTKEFHIKLKKLRKNGLIAILMSFFIASIGALFIMWNTFPDSIAVYNPFEKKISLRNLNNIDSFFMFLTSSLIVIALIINSLYFTLKNSKAMKEMAESTKVCFSMTLLTSDYWSSIAVIGPMFIFFFVLYINYSKGNIYGVAVEYLGILTYFQIIQFFKNFKAISYFVKSILQAKNIENKKTIKNIAEIEQICRMFGKFSNGVSLFVLTILCFVILIDSFNIQIVNTIIVIEPAYILGICFGSMLFYFLTSLDIKVQNNFIKLFLRKIKNNVLRNLDNEDYEPPIEELACDMLDFTFKNQLISYYIPVLCSMGLVFSLFGKKMVVIVMFGSFLLVLLTCYKNIMKSELLVDLKEIFKEFETNNYEGVNPSYVSMLSNMVGNTYKNYTNDPYSKLLILFCTGMICSQFFIDNSQFLKKLFQSILQPESEDN